MSRNQKDIRFNDKKGCPCCAFEYDTDLFLPPSERNDDNNNSGVVVAAIAAVKTSSSTTETEHGELPSISQIASRLINESFGDHPKQQLHLIDTHCHAQLYRDRDMTYDLSSDEFSITCTLEKKIRLQSLACAVEPSDFDVTLQYASSSSSILPALGVHPWYVDAIDVSDNNNNNNSNNNWIDQLHERLINHPAALVGEIGLCKIARWVRSYPDGKAAAMQKQKHVLKQQMKLAAQLQRPVSVHCVDAHGLFVSTIQELVVEAAEAAASSSSSQTTDLSMALPPAIGMHSFTGTAHHVKELLHLETTIIQNQQRQPNQKPKQQRQRQSKGNSNSNNRPTTCIERKPLFYFGFSHAVNYAMCSSEKSRRRGKEAVQAVPIDRLLVESDVHHPEDVLGGILGAIAYVAWVRDESERTIATVTTQNAQRFLAHTTMTTTTTPTTTHPDKNSSTLSNDTESTTVTSTTTTTTAVAAVTSSFPSRNVIIMSEAGKPIFALHGNPDDVSRTCSLIQALRTSTNSLGLGDVQFLTAQKLQLAFMTVGSITLVRIESLDDEHTTTTTISRYGTTEAFARLELEYVYSHLICLLSDHVQTMLQYNPSLDIRSTMMDASMESMLRNVLKETSDNVGKYLVEAIPVVSPISPDVRHQASKTLQSIANDTNNNLAFAMLVAGDQHDLVTLVQSAYRPHQLRPSDFHAIINFLGNQKEFISKNNTELWIPMCLPRFHCSGFLYAYAQCLHVSTRLALILLSSHGDTDQFELLRHASRTVQKQLGVPDDPPLATTTTTTTTAIVTVSEHVAETIPRPPPPGWSTTSMESTTMIDDDDDYVQILPDTVDPSSSHSSTERQTNNNNNDNNNSRLLAELEFAQGLSTMETICQRYLEDLPEEEQRPLHFVFRLDVPIKSPGTTGSGWSHFSECIVCSCSSSLLVMETTTPMEKNDDSVWRHRMWSNYQKLSLRLRLGSASVEATMDAFDMINDSCPPPASAASAGSMSFPGIGGNCPAMGLFESPAFASDRLSYSIDGNEMYLGMNGKDFELYMTIPTSSVTVMQAATIGTKLVRNLMSNKKSIFLSKPLTFQP
ncbi:TatD-related deoxyribonuclease [Nitzschia inconspicua]|uniref:TatD-related deoxyribonuclease n=1 Tax=Nitzschia inconspicua TaxID=303405 RepID=A0A9K3LXB6_9STRA|nr:TatD-related deoxyribonuclease [Nitzschia inconspicua]